MRNAAIDRQVFTPLEERDARLAAMQWFEAEQMSGHELFIHRELMGDFSWHGHHFHLTHQSQGIWKPQKFEAVLTFKTATPDPRKEAPYADRVDDSELPRYKFSDTKKWASGAVKVTAQRNYPLTWLAGVKPTPSALLHYARFPAYIIDIDERNAEFIIAIGKTAPATSHHKDSGQIEKKYVSRWAKERIYQHGFREHVLSACQISCTVCDLPHAQLLEASHIITDSRGAGVPEVNNGLTPCRLHHTTCDHHLLGIDVNRRIHVATRAKRIEAVHLQTDLLPFEDRSLTHMPAAGQMRPDGDRLAKHFKEFFQTKEQTVGQAPELPASYAPLQKMGFHHLKEPIMIRSRDITTGAEAAMLEHADRLAAVVGKYWYPTGDTARDDVMPLVADLLRAYTKTGIEMRAQRIALDVVTDHLATEPEGADLLHRLGRPTQFTVVGTTKDGQRGPVAVFPECRRPEVAISTWNTQVQAPTTTDAARAASHADQPAS